MGLVGASPVYRPPVAGEPLRLREDGHWSTQGLVGYWPMREMYGEVVQDVSPYGNHGTLVNGPQWKAGNGDGALRFDGTDDMIPLPNRIVAEIKDANACTISAYVYNRNLSRDGAVFGAIIGTKPFEFYQCLLWMDTGVAYGYVLAIWDNAGGNVRTSESSANAVANTWQHVVGTWDGATPRMFVDGVLVSSGPTTTMQINSFQSRPAIGADCEFGGRYLPGSIGYMSIYNRALSATEVAALYVDPDLPIWRPRRGISLALVGAGGAVLPMFGGYNLGKSLLRGANL